MSLKVTILTQIKRVSEIELKDINDIITNEVTRRGLNSENNITENLPKK